MLEVVAAVSAGVAVGLSFGGVLHVLAGRGVKARPAFLKSGPERMTVPVRVVDRENGRLPRYMTAGATCMDVYAAIPSPVVIEPGDRALIPTGIAAGLCDGLEIQVRPRSGLTHRHGVLAMYGSVDSDYRGVIGVNLFNFGKEPFTISPGERIGQIAFARYVRAELVEVDELDETERGVGGFGHTGTR